MSPKQTHFVEIGRSHKTACGRDAIPGNGRATHQRGVVTCKICKQKIEKIRAYERALEDYRPTGG